MDHLSIIWAARGVASGDTTIKEALSHNDWSDGSNPHYTGMIIIEEAYHKTNASPEELSYGNRESHTTLTINNITIFNREDSKYKTKAYWDIQLATLAKDGFNLI